MLKAYCTLLVSCFSLSALVGQGLHEAYRFTESDLSGTARYTSMAGAFGALGGDLSAISMNPASSSIFLYSELGISGTFTANEIENSYFGSKTTMKNNNFRINQGGGVMVLNNNQKNSEWTRVSFAFNANNIANYQYNFSVKGINSENGIDQYFLDYANSGDITLNDLTIQEGESIDDLYRYLGNEIGQRGQEAFLAYEGFLIESETNNLDDTSYFSNATYESVAHDYLVNQRGYHRKSTFNASALYKDFLHLGMNLNLHRIYFHQTNNLIEDGYSESSIIQLTEFENEIVSNGEGFSFQIGAIAKINEMLRLGITYDSPQWFDISDETQQYLLTRRNENDTILEALVDPQITNIFEPYRFKIPARLTSSAALVFSEKGLISVDYSTIDYRNTKLSDDFDNNSHFSVQNSIIEEQLQKVNTLRIGGELRMDKISLRAGAILEDKHHKLETEKRSAITAGLGYVFGGNTLNFGVVRQIVNNPYTLYEQGLTDRYNIQQDRFRVTVSYHLKL